MVSVLFVHRFPLVCSPFILKPMIFSAAPTLGLHRGHPA
jgi:hypothetical protein